eukprot:CAMPEP_0178440536 /NCGR_PEP_ID=MMETSP0689_2-20121128/36846_1 /TAXON_ID=160604 /ORGANISM="Amphidinium massartii, Strain CS-259" /LENGTH=124 /DNA_ID=CAMNT_0020063347 /DNA_START=472 /DNA_END=847 /DNA_ORIENTATION=+
MRFATSPLPLVSGPIALALVHHSFANLVGNPLRGHRDLDLAFADDACCSKGRRGDSCCTLRSGVENGPLPLLQREPLRGVRLALLGEPVNVPALLPTWPGLERLGGVRGDSAEVGAKKFQCALR